MNLFKFTALSLASLLGSTLASAGEKSLVDTSRSPSARMYMTGLADVKWNGGLLGERFEVCRTTMVPHMWNIFSAPVHSSAWANYRIAAGLQPGRFSGPPFNDGDFLKWLWDVAPRADCSIRSPYHYATWGGICRSHPL